LLADRDPDAEGRAAAGLGVERDLAAVARDDGARDGQANTTRTAPSTSSVDAVTATTWRLRG